MKEKLTKEEIKCCKMTEREIFEKFGKLSNKELDKTYLFLLKILS